MILDVPILRLNHRKKWVALTTSEGRILQALMKNPLCIKDRNQLLDALDPSMEKECLDRLVDSHVKRLRRKLRNTWGRDDWIVAQYGAGYYWDNTIEPEPAGTLPTYRKLVVAPILEAPVGSEG